MTCLTSDYDIMTLQTGLELTHSPTPCEFDDINQGLSLLERRIEAVFAFLCRSSSQDHLLGHTLCSPHSKYIGLVMRELRKFSLAFWVFANRWFGLDFSKRISFRPLRLVGTSKKDPCASLTLWYTVRDDLIGTCNDIRAYITDQRSSSISVLVSDGTKSEANTEK